MKVLKIIGWALLVAFIGIQFIPGELNKSDAVPNTDFFVVNNVPSSVKRTVQTSCYDCHSNNTEYPWYNKIQPIAWYLQDHVEHGKEELNFNEWDGYSSRRKNSKLKSIINQIEDSEMPLDSYTLIHRDAKLSATEKEEVLEYINELKQNLKAS